MTTQTEPTTTTTEPTPDPLAAATAELEQTRKTLEQLKRERDIHRALFEHGVNDLDIGAVLVERELAAKPTAAIPDLVTDLRTRKPALFLKLGGTEPARTKPKPGTTMSRAADAPTPIDEARTRAATGDRAALANYLRLRRQPA